MKPTEILKRLKRRITNWYYGTAFHIWYFNRKNGVKILSEKEYQSLLKSGAIKENIILAE